MWIKSTLINKTNMKNIKILLVDDEPDILEFIGYNLKKEGFEVETANNGIEGLKQAKVFRPDLILLDVMMPQMDGMEMCSELRKLDSFKDTLVVFYQQELKIFLS